jgi:hypothetical protein
MNPRPPPGRRQPSRGTVGLAAAVRLAATPPAAGNSKLVTRPDVCIPLTSGGVP